MMESKSSFSKGPEPNCTVIFPPPRLTFLTGEESLILSLKPPIIFSTYFFDPPLMTHQFGLFKTCNNPWLSKNLMKKTADISIICFGTVDHIAAPIGII